MHSTIKVFRYQNVDGREPVTDWLGGLYDKAIQARLRLRLKRLEAGNFGDCIPVGDGVLELRAHFGAGYRVYLGRHGLQVVSFALRWQQEHTKARHRHCT